MKKTIKLTNSTLKNIIAESIKNYLINEGTTDSSVADKWYQIQDMLGSEQMVNGIYNYLDSDMLKNIVEWFDTDYELGLFDETNVEDF